MYGEIPKKFELGALQHYFDGLRRDALDVAGITRKSSEVLAIRDKLITLNDQDFESAMKVIRKLVDDLYNASYGRAQSDQDRRLAGSELYGAATSGSSQIVSAI